MAKNFESLQQFLNYNKTVKIIKQSTNIQYHQKFRF